MIDKYYKILDLPNGANEFELKKAFRQLALKIHPDVNNAPDAKEKFQELCEAYEILLAHLNQRETLDATSKHIIRDDLYSWETIVKQAHERARERAKIKYEKLKAERYLFENTFWKDVIIILKYIGSISGFCLGAWLVIWPVFTAIIKGFNNLFALLFFFSAGTLLLIKIFKNPGKWFLHGVPNLHLSEIANFFDFTEFKEITTECAYCKGLKAKGRPFRLTMVKVRGVQMRNIGAGQHYARYKRNYKHLLIPRSKKAFIVHFVITFVKISAIITGVIYFPSPSFIWRFVIASFMAGTISGIILLLTRTRSKVSFLITPFNIIKIIIWLLVFLSQTYMFPGFIIASTDHLIILITAMIIFLDMIMDLIFRLLPFYPKIYHPIPRQLPGIDYLFKKGYQTYLDVPIWSTVYPFFRWLL